MIKTLVTFSKEITITVIGSTYEEIAKAAEAEAARGLPNWDTEEWDAHVCRIEFSHEAHEALKCHCGVVDGKLLHIYDYNKLTGSAIPEASE